MSEKKGMSRRQFLSGAVAASAAAAVPVLASTTPAVAAVPAALKPLTKGMTGWVPLDSKKLARQAYEIYKGVHVDQAACCEATFWPIIGELAARADTPETATAYAGWNTLPKGVFNFGGGGINSWRSICGCTNAGSAVLKLVTNDGKAIDEFLTWYEKTLLPTNATYLDKISNTWTPGGQATGWGTGAKPLAVPYNNAPKSKAQSVLCHASLTNWRVAAGSWEATKPAAQSDRCGKLCYDCVFKLCEMINAWMAGATFAGTLDASVASCGENNSQKTGCHATNSVDGKLSGGQPLAQGKMKCAPCHDQRIGDNHNQ